jgi:parallel beta-helix repeat protein
MANPPSISMNQNSFVGAIALGACVAIAVSEIAVFALTPAQVNDIAAQVSVLIGPNLTAKGNRAIVEGEKTGSGAIVARSGNTYYVVTAWHVVWRTGGFHAIVTPDGQVHYVDASEGSPDAIGFGRLDPESERAIVGSDLALLRFRSDRDYPVASVGSQKVQSGDTVYISGWPNPDDLRRTRRDRTFSAGAIAQVVNPPSADGGYSLLYDNRTRSGLSGAPIFNADGELIGIHGRGKGVENNCSTPEINARHSCGMAIDRLIAATRDRGLSVAFNRTPPRLAIDRDRPPVQAPANPTPPPVSPSPSATAAKVPDSTHTVYYVDPLRGNNSASAGNSPDNPFRTISYAIDGARPGTVINLAPGQYSSGETFPLILNRGVILQGNEGQQGEGIVIRGGGFYSTRSAANQNLTILGLADTQIVGVTISNPNPEGTGVWIEDSAEAIVRNNTFMNNGRDGIYVGGSANPTIENNRFTNSRGSGISMDRNATGEIRNNLFVNLGVAIAIGGDASPTIAANQVRANETGIVVSESSRPRLQGNLVDNNREYGLLILEGGQPEVREDNLFENNAIADRLNAPTEAWESDGFSQSSEQTLFACLEYNGQLATFVKTGVDSIPQPSIAWEDSELGSALNRCRLVTPSLNRIVALNNGNPNGIFLATGRVNNNNAICAIEGAQGVCRDENVLLYLSGEEQRNPSEVLRNLLILDRTQGRGNPVQEVETGAIVPLAFWGDRVQPEPGLWFTD